MVQNIPYHMSACLSRTECPRKGPQLQQFAQLQKGPQLQQSYQEVIGFTSRGW